VDQARAVGAATWHSSKSSSHAADAAKGHVERYGGAGAEVAEAGEPAEVRAGSRAIALESRSNHAFITP